jgi:RNA 2',3'-cyclic 3'-phosphodiesterase
VRLFVAAMLPDALASRLADAAGSLAGRELRVVPAENLHLTVHFLGEVEPDRVAELASAVRAACATADRFRLEFDSIAPGPPRRPRMLWATARPIPAYAALGGAVSEAAGAFALLARPARPGSPHITLARLRGRAQLRSWPDPRPLGNADVDVDELALVCSELGPGGSRYTIVERFPLGGQSGRRR